MENEWTYIWSTESPELSELYVSYLTIVMYCDQRQILCSKQLMVPSGPKWILKKQGDLLSRILTTMEITSIRRAFQDVTHFDKISRFRDIDYYNG